MKEGDLVLAAIPQADAQVKNRPVIILREMPPYGDWLVCGVSTQLAQEVIGFDEIVALSDVDFASSGLRAASLIRLGFLAVLPRRSVLGAIGSISSERYIRLVKRLSHYLVELVPD
jgi:mRNA interferase MazF